MVGSAGEISARYLMVERIIGAGGYAVRLNHSVHLGSESAVRHANRAMVESQIFNDRYLHLLIGILMVEMIVDGGRV